MQHNKARFQDEMSVFLAKVNGKGNSYGKDYHIRSTQRSGKVQTNALYQAARWNHLNKTLQLDIYYRNYLFPLYVIIPDSEMDPPFCFTEASVDHRIADLAVEINQDFVQYYQDPNATRLFSTLVTLVSKQIKASHFPELTERQVRELESERVRGALATSSAGCDFLLLLFHSALFSTRSTSVLSPCPPLFLKNEDKDVNTMRAVTKQLPKLGTIKSKQYDLESLPREGLHLLDFLFSRSSVKLANTEKLDICPQIDTPNFIFEVISTDDPVFEELAKKYGTTVGFHGSATENFYSILHSGLKNMSGTKYMKSGALFGEGVYLAADLDVARNFLKFRSNIWPNSLIVSEHSSLDKGATVSIGCVAVCEIIRHPDNVSRLSKHLVGPQENDAYFIVKNEHHLKLRGILVYKEAVKSLGLWTDGKKFLIALGFLATGIFVALLLSQKLQLPKKWL